MVLESWRLLSPLTRPTGSLTASIRVLNNYPYDVIYRCTAAASAAAAATTTISTTTAATTTTGTIIPIPNNSN